MKNPDTSINAQISWVYAWDLNSAAEFYSDILGFECSRNEGDAMIFKTGEGAFIGLCRAFAERVVEPRGGMISIVTDDVDAWYRRLLDKGLVIDKPPHRLEQFAIYSFFVSDPNGYVIEFQQFDSEPL